MLNLYAPAWGRGLRLVISIGLLGYYLPVYISWDEMIGKINMEKIPYG